MPPLSTQFLQSVKWSEAADCRYKNHKKWRKNIEKIGYLVYHNRQKGTFERKLHNMSSYVNECNQIHQKLCFFDKTDHIFGGTVYIKVIVKI